MPDRPRRGGRPRKDRLIQTRVPRNLEETLKEQAERRRLSVSHLIRNVLEDAFDLVDGVIDHVDVLVADSQTLGRQVGRDARDIARKAHQAGRRGGTRDAAEANPADAAHADVDHADDEELTPYDAEPRAKPMVTPPPATPPAAPRRSLDHVLAWNPVTLNRSVRCSGCAAVLERGDAGHMGVAEHPGQPVEWLCPPCVDALG